MTKILAFSFDIDKQCSLSNILRTSSFVACLVYEILSIFLYVHISKARILLARAFDITHFLFCENKVHNNSKAQNRAESLKFKNILIIMQGLSFIKT